MENIIIEFEEHDGFKVIQGKKYCDRIAYDEMLGLISSLTIPDNRPNIKWMKTKEEHESWLKFVNKHETDNQISEA